MLMATTYATSLHVLLNLLFHNNGNDGNVKKNKKIKCFFLFLSQEIRKSVLLFKAFVIQFFGGEGFILQTFPHILCNNMRNYVEQVSYTS